MSSDLIQLLLGGILLGGIYGLAAFGLSISFGVLNILNLAHGEFLMLGALLSYFLFGAFGINPFLLGCSPHPGFHTRWSAFLFTAFKADIRETTPDNACLIDSHYPGFFTRG